MKQYSAELQAALAADALVARDFLWVEPLSRDTGARIGWGAWSGSGSVLAEVASPIGGNVFRTFTGAGDLVSMTDFQMVAGLEVQTINVTLAGIGAQSEALVRGYDAKLAPIEIYRGYFSPESQRIIGAAQPLFLGFVDKVDIITPEEGGESVIALTCANHVQELMRQGTSTRSDADQKLRDPNDDFYNHSASVGTWQVIWKSS